MNQNVQKAVNRMINGLFTFTGVPKLAPILIKKVSDSVLMVYMEGQSLAQIALELELSREVPAKKLRQEIKHYRKS